MKVVLDTTVRMAMRRRKLFYRLIAGSVLGVLVLVAVAWRMGSDLLAPANHVVGSGPADLPIEATTLQSRSGSSIATWYIPAENASATIVLLHPIRGSRLTMLSRAKLFHRRGYAIVMIDLQAHGESPGEYITVGYLERLDVAAAVAYARSRNPSHQIGVVGRSLGGAAAVLGSPLGVDAMVLESVYPTIEEAVQDRIAIRLGALSPIVSPLLIRQIGPRLGISLSQLRPIERIAAVDCPLLVISGDLDRHTTLAETRRLFAAADEPKTLQIFEDAGHVDLLAANPTLYESVLDEFFQRHLSGSH